MQTLADPSVNIVPLNLRQAIRRVVPQTKNAGHDRAHPLRPVFLSVSGRHVC
ncbi:hypothetical protein BGZ61DRAFT_441102 [Ilyonectria robusta]|uniref:uncharacterized protein n=1 Tax=Ilyonectria robusta TaxID=1079257 RepID=UPI001E8D7174|nr:uncharacterized protein BGZ61DRAFT_441102 [Ilyonectria robusta]KAH8735875.1 hypothetical protein BGZ61DRAFT_441102 [Ilyonectria robusta]